MSRRSVVAAAMLACFAVSACVDANQIAMDLGQAPKVAGSMRSIQVRRFDTLNEERMVGAAAQVMQDLGFTLTEANSEVGIISGFKNRDAEEVGQITAQVIITILAALAGSSHNPTWDKDQVIKTNIMIIPIENSEQIDVRVSFAREITNNHGQLWRSEVILEPELYQEFFQKFSQSTFLEAHAL